MSLAGTSSHGVCASCVRYVVPLRQLEGQPVSGRKRGCDERGWSQPHLCTVEAGSDHVGGSHLQLE